MTTIVTVGADDPGLGGPVPREGAWVRFRLSRVRENGDRYLSADEWRVLLDDTGAGQSEVPDSVDGVGLWIDSSIQGWQACVVAGYPATTQSLVSLVRGYQVDPSTLLPLPAGSTALELIDGVRATANAATQAAADATATAGAATDAVAGAVSAATAASTDAAAAVAAASNAEPAGLSDQTKTDLSTTFVGVSRKVNGKALSADVTLTAADVGAAPKGRSGLATWAIFTDYKAQPAAPAIVAIGDSITDNNEIDTIWNGAANSRTSAYRGDGYLTRAMILAGQPCTWLEVGVFGQTTTQMLARFDTDVTPLKPRIVIEAGGTNDIILGGAATTAFANKVAMWEKAHAFGAMVIGSNCPPRNSFDDTMQNEAQKLNRLVRDYAAANTGWFRLFDWFNVLVDPLTGDYKTAYSTDGVHPNTPGALAVAPALASIILALTTPVNVLPSVNVLDNSNLIDLPLCTGTTGTKTGAGLSGTVADGFTGLSSAATAVFSKVTRPDGFGDWQQIAVSVSGNIVFQKSARASSYAPGDIIEAVCDFETDSSGWSDGDFNLTVEGVNGSNVVVQIGSSQTKGLDTALGGRMDKGVLRTVPVTLPPDVTLVRVKFLRSGTGTFRVGRFGVHVLPQT